MSDSTLDPIPESGAIIIASILSKLLIFAFLIWFVFFYSDFVVDQSTKNFETNSMKWQSCVQYCGVPAGDIPISCFSSKGTFMPMYYQMCNDK